MSDKYKANRKLLAEQLKKEPAKTPIQEVRPVEPAAAASQPVRKEAHVNFWVPDDLMERLKVYAAKSRKSIKQIGIEALESYLPKD